MRWQNCWEIVQLLIVFVVLFLLAFVTHSSRFFENYEYGVINSKVADESGGAAPDSTLRAHPGPAAFLVGPDGGFDPQERDAIRATPGAVPVSLGPRILRAETAAIAATSAWMTINGDWK